MSGTTKRADAPVARYPRSRRILHWAFAWLIAAQFALILVLHQLQSSQFGQLVLGLHRQVGTLVLIVLVASIIVRFRTTAPSSPRGIPSWQARVAITAHLLMLAMLLLLPILGLLTAWARGDQVVLFGLFAVPTVIELSASQGVAIAQAHQWLAYALLGLIGLHLGAVALNHLWRKVPVTERMLTRPAARQLTNHIPVFVQLILVCGAILASTLAAGLYGAHRYTTFNSLRAEFDEVEVARLDSLRRLQLRGHSLLNAPQDKATHHEAHEIAAAMREIAAQSAEASSDSRLLAGAARLDDLAGQAEPHIITASALGVLDDIVDDNAMRLFQRRLEIAEIAAEGHDLIILALVPTVVVSALLAFLLSRSILIALAHARRAVRAIGEGHARHELTILGNGEFAALTRAIVDMRDFVEARERARHRHDIEQSRAINAERALIIGQIATALAALARGELGTRLGSPFPGAADIIRQDFNTAAAELEAAMQRIAAASQLIETDCADVTRAAEELAARTAQQGRSLSTSTAAVACIAYDLELSSAGAQRATEIIASAHSEADISRSVVAEAALAMSSIERSSEQITDITRVIDQIARKTNTLAINARIEAARAGTSGKGFSIIAQEVRALANRASAAGREIDAVMLQSGRQVAKGVGLVQQVSLALQNIIGEVGTVDELVAQIAASLAKQSADVRQVNSAMADVGHVVRDNAQMADVTVVALRHIAGNATALDRLIQRFEVGTGEAAALEESEPTQLSIETPQFKPPSGNGPSLREVA